MQNVTDVDEIALWSSFKTGDQESFTQLYKLHVKTMFRYGMSLVPASEELRFHSAL